MSINVFCRYCGQQISDVDLVCPHCHSKQHFNTPPHTNTRRNSEGVVAFVLCFFLGFIGIHRFYYGKVGTGFLMILTMGGLGIWWLVDLIRIGVGHFTDSQGNRLSLIHDH
ncbi:TM2 domain-containing protein [Agaribacter flavus]|uniref:NINE protein n=1 Tax=Agaribacter flavus TaxID=1902781 RepID=A0ABV7FTK7_9ALTE